MLSSKSYASSAVPSNRRCDVFTLVGPEASDQLVRKIVSASLRYDSNPGLAVPRSSACFDQAIQCAPELSRWRSGLPVCQRAENLVSCEGARPRRTTEPGRGSIRYQAGCISSNTRSRTRRMNRIQGLIVAPPFRACVPAQALRLEGATPMGPDVLLILTPQAIFKGIPDFLPKELLNLLLLETGTVSHWKPSSLEVL